MTIISRLYKTNIKWSLIHNVGRFADVLSCNLRKRTNPKNYLSRSLSHDFATIGLSALERSYFSSLEGIACISLDKFVNNRVNASIVIADFVRAMRYRSRARARALSNTSLAGKRGSAKVEVIFQLEGSRSFS
ncbi:hypothetical protein P5V15_010971 [Pogonomyrmex californicus]